MSTYRVYVLLNEQAQSYIGLSENPQQRLDQHNSGLSKWTRNRGPWRIVWVSEEHSLSEARKLENRLKRQKSGRGLEHLLKSAGS